MSENKVLVSVSLIQIEGLATPLYRVESAGAAQTVLTASRALRLVRAAMGVADRKKKPAAEKATPPTAPTAKK